MKKRGLLSLLIAGLLAFSACGSKAATSVEFLDEVVMTVDGEEISKSMYMVYLYTTTQSFLSVGGEDIWTMDFDGSTADELVEERTIQTIQSVVASRKYAAENGIALSDEEKENVVTMVNEFITAVGEADIAKMGVDATTLIPMMEDSYLYSLVYQAIAAEYEILDADKDAYYQENRDTFESQYSYVDVDSIVLDDAEVAAQVLELAKAGEDFAALFDQYDIDDSAKETEEKGKMSFYISDFLSSFGFEELPEVGVIPQVVEVEGSYFILNLETINIPNDEEIRIMTDSAYANDVQAAHADSRMQELLANQEVVRVDEEFATIEKFHS